MTVGKVVFITDDGDELVRDVPDGAWDILDQVIEVIMSNDKDDVSTWMSIQKYASNMIYVCVMK